MSEAIMDIFAGFCKKYHITFDENDKSVIGEDCPKELLEEQRRIDAHYYQRTGEHLYRNFETEDAPAVQDII